ncbi:hypothetical protein HT746_19115 [Burkholderia pyrrocinia]|uniref:hypothetical protein n=1 Tax=Burkholderia pyrrocinia TaxID=60550 RepID=UPI001576FFEC|nr:hypothetical protein [Burkholderia pyrrocinia]NTX29215.1 hypothetical protein [Burkholderia pyrrocinia]
MKIDSVSISEEWGIADIAGFHLGQTYRDMPSGFPFSVCRIDGRQIAVFIEMEVPVETRADLASRKPDWLSEVVYASVLSDPRAEVAVIEAHVQSPGNEGLQIRAFATACVAFGLGLFKVVPRSYLVRFEAHPPVRVSLQFDDDTESWFGEAALDSGDS